MKRALVLGGGGVIGVAWESGLVTGLREAGLALDGFDAIVGTSAGAMVGAQVASGRVPLHPDARREQSKAQRREDAATRPPVDQSKLDMQALGKIFTLWAGMTESSREQIREIGLLARGLNRAAEADWIDSIDAVVDVADWPDLQLLVVAVDTESGERRIFTRADGAALARVLTASASVPGLFPSVEIDGRLYMDGQVHSSTNADVLLPFEPEQVLIAMPTNAFTGRGIGRHAECMLELELAALRAEGCEVKVKTPSAEDTQRMGTNLMDNARAADAYAVGLDAGRAWAEELR